MRSGQGLRAEGVTVALAGRRVLREIDAELDKGRLTVIVGPNGAGKSTLLASLAGLRRVTAGTIRLDGADLRSLTGRQRARRIAFLGQTPEIAWDVDVRTFVGLGRTAHLGAFGASAEDAAATHAAMLSTDLGGFAERIVTQLSGGERARALIARALAGETEWLLADEPLTGLDPGHALDALALFRRLAHEEGKGVIVTLHDLNLAARFADHVLVLNEGQLVIDGTAETALAPEILAAVYGVVVRTHAGEGGPIVEIVGRVS